MFGGFSHEIIYKYIFYRVYRPTESKCDPGKLGKRPPPESDQPVIENVCCATPNHPSLVLSLRKHEPSMWMNKMSIFNHRCSVLASERGASDRPYRLDLKLEHKNISQTRLKFDYWHFALISVTFSKYLKRS